MEIIPPHTPVPFRTDNEALALALQTVGERCIDVWNIYTTEILDRLNFPKARDAWREGKRGKVVFVFVRSERLPSLLKAWTEAEKSEAEETTSCELDADQVMIAARVLQRKRKEWSDAWRRKLPKVIQSTGEPTMTNEGEGYRLDIPSFTIRTIDRKAEA